MKRVYLPTPPLDPNLPPIGGLNQPFLEDVLNQLDTTLLDVSTSYPTLAAMLADPETKAGQIVATLGFYDKTDMGGAIYEIDSALKLGAANGYSVFKTESLLVARIMQSDSLVICDQYGAGEGRESSGAMNFANGVAKSLTVEDTKKVVLTMFCNPSIKNKVTFGGVNVTGLDIDMGSCVVNVLDGGNISVNNPAISCLIARSELHLPTVYANKVGAGITFKTCFSSTAYRPRVLRYIGWGIKCEDSAMGGFVIEDGGGAEWLQNDLEFHNGDTDFQYTTLFIDCADMTVTRGYYGNAKRVIYLGPNAANVNFNGVHPFNGNPRGGQDGVILRTNPVVVYSDAVARNHFNACYFENGYVQDKTNRLQIRDCFYLKQSNQVSMTVPYIRIVSMDTDDQNCAVVSNTQASVGFYMPDLVTPHPDYAWANANQVALTQAGFSTNVARKWVFISTSDDEPDFLFHQKGTKEVWQQFISNRGLDPLDDIINVKFGGGRMLVSAGIRSTGKQGMGYATGAGAVVEQEGSRTADVTIDAPCGGIVLDSAPGSTNWTTFTVNNACVGIYDVIEITPRLLVGGNIYLVHVQRAIGGGSFQVTFCTTGGTAADRPTFEFVIHKNVHS